MEGMPKPASRPEAEDAYREQLRNTLFDQVIAGKVLDAFADDLAMADMEEDTIQEIEAAFALLPEEDKKAVLAIPAQLRQPLFKSYARRIENGEIDSAGMINDLLLKAKKHGYTLGFHLSLYDIRPEQDGAWYIRGTEPDHRHDDRPMAYYSMDYNHRYRDKRTQYLYVIRAETAEGTSHYQDNDGSWGHASSLSIVEKLNMPEVEKELTERLKRVEEEKESLIE